MHTYEARASRRPLGHVENALRERNASVPPIHHVGKMQGPASALSAQRLERMDALTGTDRIGQAAAAVVRARAHQRATSLPGLLELVVNNRENGLIHRLSEASRTAPRAQRRTRCGWRAGGAAANVRFCSTCVWPPLGAAVAHRLCSKCFPSAGAPEPGRVLGDDPIAD